MNDGPRKKWNEKKKRQAKLENNNNEIKCTEIEKKKWEKEKREKKRHITSAGIIMSGSTGPCAEFIFMLSLLSAEALFNSLLYLFSFAFFIIRYVFASRRAQERTKELDF